MLVPNARQQNLPKLFPGWLSIGDQERLAFGLVVWRIFFGVVRPGIPLHRNWHLEAIAHKLSQVASGEIKRLIITVPPRSLKSHCVSVALPAWFLGHHPYERVVVASYSDPLARTHSNDFRQVVNDDLYRRVFPGMRVVRENDREIITSLRGKRIATSLDGTLTGLGGNLLIIDDPIKAADAFSQAARAHAIEWYRSTLLSRADDKTQARIIVVMQRVHENDLVGYLMAEGGFEILNLPAIAESEQTYDLGNRRTYTRHRGEILNPTHESVENLKELRRAMGPFAFNAQYQQRPDPVGGNIIKRGWLKTYEDIPAILDRDSIIMSWDIALSEAETGDYTAGVVLHQRGDLYFVREVIRGKFPFDALKKKIIDVKNRCSPASLVIEDSPISRGLIQSLKESRINVVTIRPETDKLARVIAQGDLFAGGSILLPRRAPWLENFTAELLAFPGGRHDDQVDALTQGLAWGRSAGLKRGFTKIIKGY